MGKTKIGVVEDEIVVADHLCSLLENLGYEVTEPAISYSEAIQLLEEEKPDLMLLDIQLSGRRDGIDLAWKIREDYGIPFIFLTANADVATVTRAKKVEPPAYLVKPFNKDDLYTSIEIALFNHTQHRTAAPNESTPTKNEDGYFINDALFIKDGHFFHKVKFNDILYLASEHVYVKVHTAQRDFLVRASMQDYLKHFDPNIFYRVHRSYVVNLNYLDLSLIHI